MTTAVAKTSRSTQSSPRRAAAPRAASKRHRGRPSASRSEAVSADDRPFPIVGAGASAGGLDAYKRLFAAMPRDAGVAFVLIPHLDPTHESLMVELLSKQTVMPVAEARDGMRVEPNHVYVIPPNADLAIAGGVLRVMPPPPHRGAYTAIDGFLRSLATDQQAHAVGVILSGTGNHGTAGITAIKNAGGLVLAQLPASAEQDQMPRGAIATGLVDHVLPPEQMPPVLVRYAAQLAAAAPEPTSDDLTQIVTLLRTQAKRDFRGYRTGTLLRRIKRRMALCRVDRGTSYVEYLRGHPEEVAALGKDLSIGVTAFFRDPAAFDVLEREVVPELVERSSAPDGGEHSLRVWVPGCATGEEAYSVGMLFLEQFAAANQPARVRIFATDIDEHSLDVARAGVYPDSISAAVPAARLRRFFVRSGERHYQVSKELREIVTFAAQNLLTDAPFSKLHLITCRNVLIYLDPEVQTKVLALFHFALVDGGYLLLGPAESVGSAASRFLPVSKKWRMYRRIGTAEPRMTDIPILPAEVRFGHVAPRDDRARRAAVVEVMHQALLADFAPPAVLISRQYQILCVQGPVGEYLELPPGEPTRDLLAMARPGLRQAIRDACQRAIQTHDTAVNASARLKRHRAYVTCTVTARQVGSAKNADSPLLVTFQDHARPDAGAPPLPVRPETESRADESALVGQLEHELQATRDDLQGMIDELQTSNEELKASHEEVMSMNEELQSTNEEVETSKEELQSLNEELSTVNSQLQDKVHELDAANNDMVNLLASTEIATVFLDPDLRIKRFTPPTARLLNLLPTDEGRPFRDIAMRIPDPALFDDCRRVIETFVPVETVLRGDQAEAYLRRVLPYRTADRHIDGVVITWVDMTRRLAAEAELRRLTAVLRDSNDAVVLFDLEGRVIGWNRGAERLYGYTEAEARTLRLDDFDPEPRRASAGESVRRVIASETASESFETERRTKDGRIRRVWSTMTLLRDLAGNPEAVVATERDVTEFREGVAAKQVAHLYRQVIEDLPAGAVLRKDGRLALNRAAETITGYAREALSDLDAWCTALHGDRALAARPVYEPGPRAAGAAPPISLAITRKDGALRHVELSICRLDQGYDLWMLLDMTESDRAVQSLRRSEDYLRTIVTTAADAIITIDEHGIVDSFNLAAERMFGHVAAEVVGKNVRMLMPPPTREEHDGYIDRYLKTGEARIIGIGRETIGQRKDGTTFPLDLNVSQIGTLRRFAGVLRDLSDRRALEWRLAESQMEERRQMARELHDDIGGHMTGVGLLAQTLHAELQRSQSPAADRAQELIQVIGQAQQRLRSVIRGLMPVDEIPQGLMTALQALTRQCESVSGIPCRFECDPPVHVEDASTAKHLYRIAQEAINNAIRHSHASQFTVGLARVGAQIEVVVSDDGVGVGEAKPGQTGIGLASMRQRASLLGGDCAVRPRPGGGTTVRCRVPASPRPTGVAVARERALRAGVLGQVRPSPEDARETRGSVD